MIKNFNQYVKENFDYEEEDDDDEYNNFIDVKEILINRLKKIKAQKDQMTVGQNNFYDNNYNYHKAIALREEEEKILKRLEEL